MKKTIALCLAGAMGLSVCGLAACDKFGAAKTDPVDPETIASDKIETDEQWDKAMRDTFTYLFDFEGEDDATKMFAEFPYWHPTVGTGLDAFDHDLKLAQDKNFEVNIFMDVTATGERSGYERWNCSTAYDMGKYHSVYEYAGEVTDADNGGSPEKAMLKFEEYMKYNESGKLLSVCKITEHEGEGVDLEGDPLNVWSNELHTSSIGDLTTIEFFFNFSHLGVLKDLGDTYFEEHSSIFEFAKYDEEKKGYVITDKDLLAHYADKEQLTHDGAFGTEGETTYTFKFKDGKLVSAWIEEDYGEMVLKQGFTITYGGQKVTFPDELPW